MTIIAYFTDNGDGSSKALLYVHIQYLQNPMCDTATYASVPVNQSLCTVILADTIHAMQA